MAGAAAASFSGRATPAAETPDKVESSPPGTPEPQPCLEAARPAESPAMSARALSGYPEAVALVSEQATEIMALLGTGDERVDDEQWARAVELAPAVLDGGIRAALTQAWQNEYTPRLLAEFRSSNEANIAYLELVSGLVGKGVLEPADVLDGLLEKTAERDVSYLGRVSARIANDVMSKTGPRLAHAFVNLLDALALSLEEGGAADARSLIAHALLTVDPARHAFAGSRKKAKHGDCYDLLAHAYSRKTPVLASLDAIQALDARGLLPTGAQLKDAGWTSRERKEFERLAQKAAERGGATDAADALPPAGLAQAADSLKALSAGFGARIESAALRAQALADAQAEKGQQDRVLAVMRGFVASEISHSWMVAAKASAKRLGPALPMGVLFPMATAERAGAAQGIPRDVPEGLVAAVLNGVMSTPEGKELGRALRDSEGPFKGAEHPEVARIARESARATFEKVFEAYEQGAFRKVGKVACDEIAQQAAWHASNQRKLDAADAQHREYLSRRNQPPEPRPPARPGGEAPLLVHRKDAVRERPGARVDAQASAAQVESAAPASRSVSTGSWAPRRWSTVSTESRMMDELTKHFDDLQFRTSHPERYDYYRQLKAQTTPLSDAAAMWSEAIPSRPFVDRDALLAMCRPSEDEYVMTTGVEHR